MTMLRQALKEWAVICRALAEGRQALLLRKGGIAESAGAFTVKHRRFWLFPTFVHQQKDGILTDAVSLLERVEADRPPKNVIRLTHFAEVAGIYQVGDVAAALKLEGLHCWSQETVEARFRYRQPGLHVLPVRVFRSSQVFEIPDTAGYAGCKSWVELDQALPTDNAEAVLTEEAFDDVLGTLDRLLEPTALA
jgi:hypothetical protein